MFHPERTVTITIVVTQRRRQRGEGQRVWPPIEKLAAGATAWESLLPVLHMHIPCWSDRNQREQP